MTTTTDAPSTVGAPQAEQFCKMGMAVIKTEAEAVIALTSRIGHDFSRACQLLLTCKGRIVVLGMGKSGHIGSKIAATLASTGTPAFFVHPGEASHGDMGMITSQDVVISLSYSGETQELLDILPLIKRLGVPMIAITGQPLSTLATMATVNIDVSVTKEACPLGLAPTSSTTATLVMGDALAIALLEARGFTPNDFALFHPGGSLGRRLRQLLMIDEIMHTGSAMPILSKQCSIQEALLEISGKSLGMAIVTAENGELAGIFTDGDLRRTLEKRLDIDSTPLDAVMTKNPRTLTPKTLAAEALQLMQLYKISSLVVVDTDKKPIGILHLHDLLQSRVI